ncbi:MAG: PadR family transcriptional regulator [Clostridiales bacterium]|jgi:DNA-binding PadR family transcriptional regulator|nr:PadR family transcriptional regulator [Clostridiales bacterium]
MSFKHAILGLLSYTPLTGYDIKKLMQESTFMYWSGNNNQIYKALIEMDGEGLIHSETIAQASAPPKKVYTLTDGGLDELTRWLESDPEAPDCKKPFLVQFAWAGQLGGGATLALLGRYEQAVKARLGAEQEKKKRGRFSLGGTPMEAAIWELLYENIVGSYESELEWVAKVRKAMGKYVRAKK